MFKKPAPAPAAKSSKMPSFDVTPLLSVSSGQDVSAGLKVEFAHNDATLKGEALPPAVLGPRCPSLPHGGQRRKGGRLRAAAPPLAQ